MGIDDDYDDNDEADGNDHHGDDNVSDEDNKNSNIEDNNGHNELVVMDSVIIAETLTLTKMAMTTATSKEVHHVKATMTTIM